MRWLVLFFGSGWAFFAGAMTLLLVVFARPRQGTGWRTRGCTIFAFAAISLIALSAAPLPPAFYLLWFAIDVVWLTVWRTRGDRAGRLGASLRIGSAFLTVVAVTWELPYQFSPLLPPSAAPAVTILADSITAGVGDGTVTWPRLIAASRPVDVHDYSVPGATVGMALRKARSNEIPAGFVLLEIGGNDLLGSTSDADFERDLDALLKEVTRPGRTVVLFELPLPPLRNEYGRIQRRVAARHGVHLIPKRVLADLLAGSDSTLDSIHLTQAGQDKMADVVWGLIAGH